MSLIVLRCCDVLCACSPCSIPTALITPEMEELLSRHCFLVTQVSCGRLLRALPCQAYPVLVACGRQRHAMLVDVFDSPLWRVLGGLAWPCVQHATALIVHLGPSSL